MDWLIDYYNWRIVGQYTGQFTTGLVNTLIAAGASLVLSVLAGIPLALAHMSARAWVWRPVAGYVQFIRSTPLLVQIYLVYYAVPMLVPGAKGWSEMLLGILAMTLHHAAYMSEIIRVGIESVPRGQIEGAKACGMNYHQRLRYVVLPQALRIAVAPTVGFAVQIVKSTALTSIIGFTELSKASTVITNATFSPFTVYACAALIYFALCWPLSRLSLLLERKLHAPHRS